MSTAGIVMLFIVVFISGYSTGQWVGERQVRREQAEQLSGRINVSMPANPEQAARALELLADLMRKVEQEPTR